MATRPAQLADMSVKDLCLNAADALEERVGIITPIAKVAAGIVRLEG